MTPFSASTIANATNTSTNTAPSHLITIIADAMISSHLSAQARRVCEVMMARERDPFYACLAGSLGMT